MPPVVSDPLDLALLAHSNLLTAAALHLFHRRRRRRRFRSYSVCPVNQLQKLHGHYYTLLPDFIRFAPTKFFQYTRLTYQQFEWLDIRIRDRLTHANTASNPISSTERLAVTLHWLATGGPQTNIAFNYRLGKATVHAILHETTVAIYEELQPLVMPAEFTTQDWLDIADDYARRWQVYNCMGALDGKHIAMKRPSNSGELYRNYKGFYSIVLMAMCDATLRFTWVDVGAPGRHSDGGVFSRTALGQCLDTPGGVPLENPFNIPPPRFYPGCDQRKMPFAILADPAFKLRPNLQKPFPNKEAGKNKNWLIYNYRQSRGRLPIECAFGVFAGRWQLMLVRINGEPDLVKKATKAAVVLHNLCILNSRQLYCPTDYMDAFDSDGQFRPGKWREEVDAASRFTQLDVGRSANAASKYAKQVREHTAAYYMSPQGSVPWQEDYALDPARMARLGLRT